METNRPSQNPIAIRELIQPIGGLFKTILRSKSSRLEPGLSTRLLPLGNIKEVSGSSLSHSHELSGCGTDINDGDALFLAAAEGLERYCACIYEESNFVVAAANDLGDEALDLDTIPRCSEAELSHPKCPLVRPRNNAPIRWVRGISLMTGKTKYLPVVMVYLFAGYASAAERFWLPITTGCAAHESYASAILSGILEVVERDALTIIWLNRCPLPRIKIDEVCPRLEPYWNQYQLSTQDTEYIFFDATTDLGIPVVYCLRRAENDKELATIITCSCNLDPSFAVGKVICDIAPLRLALQRGFSIPTDFSDFTGIFHGAAFMAKSEQQPAFQFLMDSTRHTALSAMKKLKGTSPEQELSFVLDLLEARNLEAYAVDLTTDEALRCGTRVVRVVIPGLQPLSFHYRARYLGHKRIYEAPSAMGCGTTQEEDLNRWPQPFA
ncbi:MAG TPA: YcaO-like family protein [Candidatus Angelobacter sp.]|nr:YcaO-like family protein [Candidatus Angelobacter sp.]